VTSLTAQVTQQMLQQQLLERGIDENEFRQKLQERGVTYESIEQVPPEQYAEVEGIVREIIAEMEREKVSTGNAEKIQSAEPGSSPQLDPLDATLTEAKESIIDGASIEEAVAEAVTEEQPDLPPARIYGQEIFRDQTLKVFRQADNIKPKENYLLGPGDEVTISIWGASIFERTYTIDDAGYINPAAMPRIFLKNMTFRSAKQKLERSFAAFNRFNSDQFEVSLRYARTLSIGIFGEVFHPGNHTISAINSAFNALVAAGGPTDIGTLRNIKWIKSDGSVEKIDVYKYMIDPTIADQFYLSDNDILQIPIAQRMVSINGSVNRPMRYELIEGEHLVQLLDYAGGFKPNAYKEIIQLKRFENDMQKVIDINYNELMASGGDFTLKNGDAIHIRTIPSPIRNFVSIAGPLELPGQYEYREGMRISDLLSKAILSEDTERSYAVLSRSNRDGTANFIRVDLAEILRNSSSTSNMVLMPGDALTLYSKGKYVDQYQVTVRGEVRTPRDFAYDPSQTMRIRDAITMAGGLTAQSTDFAYLVRRQIETDEPVYIKLNVRELMSDPNSDQNLILQPKDVISIQSQKSFIDEANVSIDGAVRNSGTFTFDESMTLKDLITLANGLRMEAARNRVEVSRMVIEQNEPTKVVIATLSLNEDYEAIGATDFELQPYDQVFVRTVPEFEFQQKVSISGEVKFPGPYTIISDNERITSLIKRAGGLTDEAFPQGALLVRALDGTGPIVIELDKVLENERSDANIILRAGDQVQIPKIKDFVSVGGAVNTTKLYRQDLLSGDNRVTVIFDGRKSARYYIEKFAGGFADNGSRRKVTVEYPNGMIKEVKDYGVFLVYPKVEKGAIVRVGSKDVDPEKQKPEGESVDWGEVLANAVTQATAVLTLILLIDRAGR